MRKLSLLEMLWSWQQKWWEFMWLRLLIELLTKPNPRDLKLFNWSTLKKFFPNFCLIFLDQFSCFQMDMKIDMQDVDLRNNLALKAAGTFVFHPMELSKVLIQIGHEPLAPRNTKTLLGRPALAYPSVFQVRNLICLRIMSNWMWGGGFCSYFFVYQHPNLTNMS